jgi:hypothetical protein
MSPPPEPCPLNKGGSDAQWELNTLTTGIDIGNAVDGFGDTLFGGLT